MKLIDVLDQIEKVEINEERVKEVKKIYSCELTEFLKKYISFVKDSIVIEKEMRTLTYYEIRHPNDISEDLLDNSYFPVLDCNDGTIACYSIRFKKWILYNIFDEVEFENASSLMELLK